MKRQKILYGLLAILATSFAACQKDEDVAITTLKIENELIEPSYTMAEIAWDVSSNATINEVMFQYANDSAFTQIEEQSMTRLESGGKRYSIILSPLDTNTTYYIRCKAINRFNSCISKSFAFTTKAYALATIQMDSVSHVGVSYANLNATLVERGMDELPEVGFYWAEHPNVKNTDSCIIVPFEKPENATKENITYNYWLQGLKDGKTYYVCAYAANKAGLAFSEEMTFRTIEGTPPNVGFLSVTDISYTQAHCTGNVYSDGGMRITGRGVCYATHPKPTIEDTQVVCDLSTHVASDVYEYGVGKFECLLTGLKEDTRYYACAYAINEKGIAYGPTTDFTTKAHTTPTVMTYSTTDILCTTATCCGYISDNGGVLISEKGICYSSSQTPTANDKKVVDDNKNDSICCILTNLESDSTYYYRAYAINEKGIGYGEIMKFQTLTYSVPTIAISKVNNVSSSAATCIISINDDGCLEITEAGVCYSTSPDPTTENGKVVGQIEDDNYICQLLDLKEKTTYYIRAYAINSKGTGYSEQREIRTPSSGVPVVSIDEPWDVTNSSATCRGRITDYGQSSVTEYGVCYSTSPNPTTDNQKVSFEGETGVFTCYLKNLTGETTYYACAYAINNQGTGYSEVIEFTTSPTPSVPTIVVNSAAEITSSSVNMEGEITSMGNVGWITHYGFVWSVNDEPTFGDGQFNDLGATSTAMRFSSVISGLEGYTLYYCRAYATNEQGTAYSDTYTFTTLVGDVVLITNAPTSVSDVSATITGEITDTGGNEIIEKGVCWSSSSIPDINSEHVTASSSTPSASVRGTLSGNQSLQANANHVSRNVQRETLNRTRSVQNIASNMSVSRKSINGGTFTCDITGLQPLTNYYARAYVKTADWKIYYGNEQQFTTVASITLPVLSSVQVSDIKTTSASFTASIVSNGNATITQAGFCWSDISATPSLQDNSAQCDPQSIVLGKNVTNLQSNTTYYVRAYATNSKGTVYSAVAEFSTLEITRPVIGAVTVDNVGKTSAYVSAELTSDGNTAILERGFCWATSPSPSVYDNKVVVGDDKFSVKLTGLPELTTIYVRAFATNSKGTTYSGDVQLTTVDVDYDIWDGKIATKFGGGLGTADNPILVTAADQLALLAKNVNNGTTYDGVYFKLTTHISLENLNWEPIGNNSSKVFAGNFDGAGMSISGMNNVSGFGGLFGNNSGTIQNLNVSGKSTGASNMAGITGINSGTIAKCISSVVVNGNGIAGGIAGYSTGIISNCMNHGTISSTSNNVGGITGESVGGSYYNNMNTASVTGSDYVGGICGYYSFSATVREGSESKAITNSVNKGTITATNGSNGGAGGIIGYVSVTNNDYYDVSGRHGYVIVQIINSYNLGQINNNTGRNGGICGYAYLNGSSYSYSSGSSYNTYNWNSSYAGCLYIHNCISENAGLVGAVEKVKRQGRSYWEYASYAKIDYGYSYWLYDIANNRGQEVGVGTENYIDAWYNHDNSGCYLKNTHDDIVTLLNSWVNSNNPTEYKQWKYETIDGFAVPVFDE